MVVPVRIVVKERNHLHLDGIEESRLVDGDIDGMVTGFHQKIGFFRWLDADRQQHRATAGCADPEVGVPFIHEFDDFWIDGDVMQIGPAMRIHYAHSIGMAG